MKLTYFKAYAGALFAFCLMDGLWLGVFATEFYFDALGELLRKEPNWSAAVVFYLGYIGGIVYFVIRPALSTGSFWIALRDGLNFGSCSHLVFGVFWCEIYRFPILTL